MKEGRLAKVLAAVVAALVLLPASAQAATTWFVSQSGSDLNACTQLAPCASISQAVSVAASGDTIDVGPGTFRDNVTVNSGVTLTINGAGATATVVNGGAAGSVFTNYGALTLSNLTVTDGSASDGGGIYSAGTAATLDRVIVSANQASFDGGGVFADEGTLTVLNSAIAVNSAVNAGGGISVDAGAEVVGSAIYGNSSMGGPGGGGVYAVLGVVLADDTIAQNTAPAGGGLSTLNGTPVLAGDTIVGNTAQSGGGIYDQFGHGSAYDTIVAANGGGNCGVFPNRPALAVSGYDLEDDAGASCGFSAASHDLVGVDPELGILAANGGPTNTIALNAGSPAIGAGNCTQVDSAVGADVDQRGFPRRFAKRGVCDIGAWDSGGSLTGVVVQTGGPLQATQDLPARVPLAAGGGTGVFTWSVVSGSLPAGLTLRPGGVISGTPSAAGTSSFTVKVTDNAKPPRSAEQALSMVVYSPPQPAVWAATGVDSTLRAFALGLSVAVSPSSTLGGPMTGLDGPDGLAFDPNGDLYVANADTPSVTEYQAGASGNAPPIRTIAGSNTDLFSPAGVALDAKGDVYVSNQTTNTITVYGPHASGDVAPLRMISGSSTGLGQPTGVTIDAAGNLWVANYGLGTLTEYRPGASGDVAPKATITGLNGPFGLGQDAAGHLLVTSYPGNTAQAYADAPPFGNASPVGGVGGSAAQLNGPRGIDVDAAGNWYVANFSGINVFAPGASSPEAIIDLSSAQAVAVEPPLEITTPRLPAAALGRRYDGRIGAVLGKRPLRWRLVRGRLPRGLRLGRDGVIRGVPRELGVFHFTVAVRDSSRHAMKATQRITLVVVRAPTISAVRSRSGPARGGRRITVIGTGFALGRGTTTISFGRVNAIGVVCHSHTRCTARTPPHQAGTVSLTVTVDGVRSATVPPVRYRYLKNGA